ncbi:hypothetical protein [uncultured Hydrogenophaga sp.]|uniref:hypothetical protein n=1 Tax=uncultured Hydrogenophaga sp. TaxID=199683 RepID=UPI00266024D0|nr:hypothetical protein [uncultured Hydrogenophaga sp.]
MAPLLTIAAGLLGEFVSDWKAKRQNQRDVERAVTENRVRMAADAQAHNNEWEMRALEGSDRWLRRFSFAAWSAPMVWAAINPTGAAEFFTVALAGLPDWYVGGYLGITGAVWGIAEMRHLGVIKR